MSYQDRMALYKGGSRRYPYGPSRSGSTRTTIGCHPYRRPPRDSPIKKMYTKSNLTGSVKAWSERPELDGTNHKLHEYRKWFNEQSPKCLTQSQYDAVKVRFTKLERVSDWLKDINCRVLMDPRIYWNRNKHLNDSQIRAIEKKYFKSRQRRTMSSAESYSFWRNLRFRKGLERERRMKCNLDGSIKIYRDGYPVLKNPHRSTDLDRELLAAWRQFDKK